METNLYDILDIPDISEYKNYWFVRSNNGQFYDDFVMHGYVAVAWDHMTLKSFMTNSREENRRLISMAEASFPSAVDIDEDDDEVDEAKSENPEDETGKKKGIVTSIYNKLNMFINEMKVGDIILVPSKNSQMVSVGIIDSAVYENDDYIQEYIKQDADTSLVLCPYRKRRNIKWLKKLSRFNRDVYLIKAFRSQHAVSNMTEYASLVDRAIYPLYKKNNEVHTTLHAGHPNGLTTKALANFLNRINDTIDDIARQCELPINDNDLQLKLNIHSPGLLEFIGYGSGLLVALSVFGFFVNHTINGGKVKLSFKKDVSGNIDFSVESESQGILGRDLERKELEIKEKELLISAIKELDIKSYDD